MAEAIDSQLSINVSSRGSQLCASYITLPSSRPSLSVIPVYMLFHELQTMTWSTRTCSKTISTKLIAISSHNGNSPLILCCNDIFQLVQICRLDKAAKLIEASAYLHSPMENIRCSLLGERVARHYGPCLEAQVPSANQSAFFLTDQRIRTGYPYLDREMSHSLCQTLVLDFPDCDATKSFPTNGIFQFRTSRTCLRSAADSSTLIWHVSKPSFRGLACFLVQ